MKNTEKTMDKIVALCKGRGFIFAGSEIYGGLANTWDYGPLGVELKNNVKRAWWKKFVQENKYNVGLDAAILMNPQTWVASGHLAGFSDPLMDCRECHERFRADKLIEDYCEKEGVALPKPIDAFSQAEMKAFIEEHNIPCPTCGKHNFTDIRQFNLMLSAHMAAKTFPTPQEAITVSRPSRRPTFISIPPTVSLLLSVSAAISIQHPQGTAPAGAFSFLRRICPGGHRRMQSRRSSFCAVYAPGGALHILYITLTSPRENKIAIRVYNGHRTE